MKKKSNKTHKNNTGAPDNVNRRKRANNALRESAEKYATLVENAADGVTIIQDKVIKFAKPV